MKIIEVEEFKPPEYPPDAMVEIGPLERAPLKELLEAVDPRCNYCRGGWVTMVTPGQKERSFKVCGCCKTRWRKAAAAKKAAEIAPNLVIAPLPSEGERRRLARRLERLGDEVERLEVAISKRTSKRTEESVSLVAAIAAAKGQADLHTKNAADQRHIAEAIRAGIGHLENELANAKRSLAEVERTQATDREAADLAKAMETDLEARLVRHQSEIDEDTKGLRKELERARRRLATARAYNVTTEVSSG